MKNPKYYQVKLKFSRTGFKNSYVTGLVKANNPTEAKTIAIMKVGRPALNEIGDGESECCVHSCKLITTHFIIGNDK